MILNIRNRIQPKKAPFSFHQTHPVKPHGTHQTPWSNLVYQTPAGFFSWEVPTHPEECTKLRDLQLLIQPGSQTAWSFDQVGSMINAYFQKSMILVDDLWFILHISLHHKKGCSNHLIPSIPYIVLCFFFGCLAKNWKIICGIREGQPPSYLPWLSGMLLNLHDIKQWTLDVRALSLSLSFSTRWCFTPLFNTSETWNYETSSPSYTCSD